MNSLDLIGEYITIQSISEFLIFVCSLTKIILEFLKKKKKTLQLYNSIISSYQLLIQICEKLKYLVMMFTIYRERISLLNN